MTKTTCGDGIEAGLELCDMKNIAGNQCCNVGCTAFNSATFNAEGENGCEDNCCPKCGDGLHQTGEQCDGNNGGCESGCIKKAGWDCQRPLDDGGFQYDGPSWCSPICLDEI